MASDISGSLQKGVTAAFGPIGASVGGLVQNHLAG